MKSFRSTLIFAVIVVLGGGLVYWDHQNSQKQKEADEKKELIVDFAQNDVTQVEIKAKNKDLLVKKENGNWQILKPLEDAGDAEIIGNWLTDLLAQRGRDLTSSARGETSSEIEWSKFFLTEDATKLQVWAGGKSVELRFGTSNAFDGNFYIRRGDSLILGSPGWAAVLEKDPQALRNRQIYSPLKSIAAVKIERQGRKPIQLSLNDQRWIMEGRNYQLSDFNLLNFFDDLKALRSNQVMPETVNKNSLKKYKLDKPVTTILVSEKETSDPVKLFFSDAIDGSGDVYVYTTRSPAIYKLAKTSMDKITVTEDSFRDGRAPFAVDIAKVDKVKVKTGGVERVFEKKKGKWEATTLGPDEIFVESRMTTFLMRLQDFDARLFLGEKDIGPQAGVENIELSGEGKVLLSISMGEEFNSGDVVPHLNPLRYIKTNLTSELLAVRSVSPQLLMQQLPAVQKTGENVGSDPSIDALRQSEDHGHSH